MVVFLLEALGAESLALPFPAPSGFLLPLACGHFFHLYRSQCNIFKNLSLSPYLTSAM